MKPTPDISWKVNITDYLSASISDQVGIIFAVKMIVYPLDRSQIQMSNAATALFDKCEKKHIFKRFYLDFWWNWDRFSFNKISVKIPNWQNHHFWNVQFWSVHFFEIKPYNFAVKAFFHRILNFWNWWKNWIYIFLI